MIATIAAGITIFANIGNGVGVGVGEEVIGVTEMVEVVALWLDGTSSKSVVVLLARRGISVAGVVGGVVDLWHGTVAVFRFAMA